MAETTSTSNLRRRAISVAVFLCGVISLVAGVVALVYGLARSDEVSAAAFLVKAGPWQRQDAPDVTWQFTSIGAGTLTTDGGEHEYPFTWALVDGQLKVDTEWLYTLNDAYDFSLNQSTSKFTLKTAQGTVAFVPVSAASTEDSVLQPQNSTLFHQN